MTFFWGGKLSITLENKYPSDPYKNQGPRPAYGNYFPLDRDLQKRGLAMLCSLLVAALLNCSPHKDNKVNSHQKVPSVLVPLQGLEFISALWISAG